MKTVTPLEQIVDDAYDEFAADRGFFEALDLLIARLQSDNAAGITGRALSSLIGSCTIEVGAPHFGSLIAEYLRNGYKPFLSFTQRQRGGYSLTDIIEMGPLVALARQMREEALEGGIDTSTVIRPRPKKERA